MYQCPKCDAWHHNSCMSMTCEKLNALEEASRLPPCVKCGTYKPRLHKPKQKIEKDTASLNGVTLNGMKKDKIMEVESFVVKEETSPASPASVFQSHSRSPHSPSMRSSSRSASLSYSPSPSGTSTGDTTPCAPPLEYILQAPSIPLPSTQKSYHHGKS